MSSPRRRGSSLLSHFLMVIMVGIPSFEGMTTLCSRAELNCHQRFRKPSFYPLNYRSSTIFYHKFCYTHFMKIYFLGTNGWYTSPTGDTPCILIDSRERYVIFDAGNALYKIEKYIKEDKPISLFISHFHIDHVSGLHMLVKFIFKQGIDVYFAKGRKKDFDLFVNPPYTIGINKNETNIFLLPTKVRLHELEEGDNDVGFPVKMIKLYHAYENHGFKIK